MKKTVFLLAGLILAALTCGAQDAFRGAYFMDTYLYGHTMNPALTANRSYASVGLGNIDLQTQTNLSASTFFYPTNGGVLTFLSDAVPAETFLSKIHRHNSEQLDLRLDLINFGFWTKSNQFHNFSLNVRLAQSAAIPYDIFRFLKNGSTDGTDYDLSGAGMRLRAYGEAAYGISFPVTDEIRIGGKVKALVGLAYADARFNRLDVTLSGERWSVSSEGQMLSSSNLPTAQTIQALKPEEYLNLDNIDFSTLKPSGFGAAIDLGATWDILPWLQLSASVTDLGFISYKMNRSTTQGSWEYTGFDNISFDGENDLEDQLQAKLEQLQKLTEFRKVGTTSAMDFLPATFYVGAKAKPNDWFAAGLLGTVRSQGAFSWAEMRGSVNLEPCHWFGWAGSIAYGTFGPKFASMLNLRLGPIGLSLGGEITSPYFISTEPRASHTLEDYWNGDVVAIPRDNLNVNLMVGLNLVFGKTPAKRNHTGKYAEPLSEQLD
jgi:hypothetical protein